MFKQGIEINPSLLRMSAGIPVAGLGGLMGYLTAPKEHRLEGMARGAGIGYFAGTGAGVGAELASRAATDDTQALPYMIPGAAVGGALGFGVGNMMQGTPEWERRRKFREELLHLLHEESDKIKTDIRGQQPAAIQKISSDIIEFARENPELAVIPTAASLGAAVTDDRESTKKHIRNALLGAGTAASAVGTGAIANQFTNDSGTVLTSGAAGGLGGFLLLRNLLKEEEEKKKVKYGTAGPVLQKLLEAKKLSDMQDYDGKHQRLRDLMDKHPDDFFVDSMQGNIVGVTHRPTGFRMHAPIRVLPSSLRGRVNVNEFTV